MIIYHVVKNAGSRVSKVRIKAKWKTINERGAINIKVAAYGIVKTFLVERRIKRERAERPARVNKFSRAVLYQWDICTHTSYYSWGSGKIPAGDGLIYTTNIHRDAGYKLTHNDPFSAPRPAPVDVAAMCAC
jgi:hypothetical protein